MHFSLKHKYTNIKEIRIKRVGMIRVNVGPISETVYVDIILNTIIERQKK
jgi:hypothetical protein